MRNHEDVSPYNFSDINSPIVTLLLNNQCKKNYRNIFESLGIDASKIVAKGVETPTIKISGIELRRLTHIEYTERGKRKYKLIRLNEKNVEGVKYEINWDIIRIHLSKPLLPHGRPLLIQTPYIVDEYVLLRCGDITREYFVNVYTFCMNGKSYILLPRRVSVFINYAVVLHGGCELTLYLNNELCSVHPTLCYRRCKESVNRIIADYRNGRLYGYIKNKLSIICGSKRNIDCMINTVIAILRYLGYNASIGGNHIKVNRDWVCIRRKNGKIKPSTLLHLVNLLIYKRLYPKVVYLLDGCIQNEIRSRYPTL